MTQQGIADAPTVLSRAAETTPPVTFAGSQLQWEPMNSHWLQPVPALAEHTAEIEIHLERCAVNLQPEDLREMLGKAGREMVAVTVAALKVDSASIWLADRGRTRLIVSHVYPKDEALMNRAKPIGEGLVSLVLQSEQPLCENQVYSNAAHSRQTDEALGKVTCAMLAVPLHAGGEVCGVLSCVRMKDSADAPDPPSFSSANLARMRRLSKGIEHLLNYRMLSAILGLDL